MRISFQVEESFEEILQAVKTDNKFWESVSRESDRDMKYRLHDRDFPSSWAEVTVVNEKYPSSPRRMFIETAWSRFSYEISQSPDEKTLVIYDGAYRGLLEQILIPGLTPINLMSSKVSSSLKNCNTLAEYAELQAGLHDYKVSNGLNAHVHTHPGCVYRIIELLKQITRPAGAQNH